MLDIKFVRENPEIVKQNIRNKFQDSKLELVDKVLELDKENREIKQEVEALRAERNKISKQIGALMGQGKKDEAEEVKKQVAASGERIEELSKREKEVEEELLKDMMVIPNIIDPSVPIGKDDSENVEIEKFGEPVVPDFEVPYHTEIMEEMCIRDREGPFDLGVSITETVDDDKETRIIYYSTSNLLQSQINQMVSGGNEKLVMTSLRDVYKRQAYLHTNIQDNGIT